MIITGTYHSIRSYCTRIGRRLYRYLHDIFGNSTNTIGNRPAQMINTICWRSTRYKNQSTNCCFRIILIGKADGSRTVYLCPGTNARYRSDSFYQCTGNTIDHNNIRPRIRCANSRHHIYFYNIGIECWTNSILNIGPVLRGRREIGIVNCIGRINDIVPGGAIISRRFPIKNAAAIPGKRKCARIGSGTNRSIRSQYAWYRC